MDAETVDAIKHLRLVTKAAKGVIRDLNAAVARVDELLTHHAAQPQEGTAHGDSSRSSVRAA